MTADQRFSIIITGMGLIFTVLSAVLAMIIRITVKWTQTQDQLVEVTKDIQDLQRSTDERLKFLERFAWPQGRRRMT